MNEFPGDGRYIFEFNMQCLGAFLMLALGLWLLPERGTAGYGQYSLFAVLCFFMSFSMVIAAGRTAFRRYQRNKKIAILRELGRDQKGGRLAGEADIEGLL